MIRGLDDDEVDFLEHVDRAKIETERQQREEERKLLLELKNRPSVIVSTKEQLEAELKPKSKISAGLAGNRPSQKSILAGIVRKRSTSEANGSGEADSKKLKPANGTEGGDYSTKASAIPELSGTGVDVSVIPRASLAAQNNLKCIGVLPGIGSYRDTSDSDDSSDVESPTRYDLTGKRLTKDGKPESCE